MDNKKKSALYIHIPFCVKKCAYCDFASYEDFSMQEVYFDALKKEIRVASEQWSNTEFDTLFLGGGTPSSVKNEYIEGALDAINKYFKVRFIESTIEANPGTVDWHKLQFYRYLGIDRISFGVQAAQDDLLSKVGRIHTFEEVQENLALACRAGFANISIDLMSGLPEQTEEDLLESVEQAKKLCVSHVSLYTLKLEEGTRLYDDVEKGRVSLPSKDEEYEMSFMARKRLKEHGYSRYEISNYAKEGFECKHNLHYWHNDDYLGLGLAAASAQDGLRSINSRDMGEYLFKINSGDFAYEESVKSSDEEFAYETLMLGLRLTRGVNIEEYKSRHNINLLERLKSEIESFSKRGLAEVSEGRFFFTEKGLDLQNSLLVDIMEKFDF